jgi:hypothetical protein
MASKGDIEDLVKEAKPLWLAFRKRAQNPTYASDIRDVLIAIDNAISALNSAGRSISKLRLDKLHGDELITIWKAAGNDPHKVVDCIVEAVTRLTDFAGELSQVTSVLLKRPANRPQAKYVLEVLELMRFYVDRTGNRTLFPKRMDRKTEEANQDSTEFIHQCLRRIEPEVKLRQVISAIRNAQMMDKQINALLRELRVK